MRLCSGDKHHPKKSADRKAHIRKVLVSLSRTDLCFSICRFSRVVFIPRAQPHAESLFLFPKVFGINFNFAEGLSYDLSKFSDDFTPFFSTLKDHNFITKSLGNNIKNLRQGFVARNMMHTCEKFHKGSLSDEQVKFNLARAIHLSERVVFVYNFVLKPNANEQLRWHVWPTFPLTLIMKFSQKLSIYFFYTIVHKVQKFKSRGPAAASEGGRRDRNMSDIFAHCSLVFYFHDLSFSIFVLLNFILWSSSFF